MNDGRDKQQEYHNLMGQFGEMHGILDRLGYWQD